MEDIASILQYGLAGLVLVAMKLVYRLLITHWVLQCKDGEVEYSDREFRVRKKSNKNSKR